MTTYFPIVVEVEASGGVSAYVPGLPVYAAADTRPKVEQAIAATLAAYLEAHPDSKPTSRVRVARVTGVKVDMVGVGALLGATRSVPKARASQRNGQLGGRPFATPPVISASRDAAEGMRASNASVKVRSKRLDVRWKKKKSKG
jgi:hypothetical protein